MNKISFTIPNTKANTNKDKIEDKIPLELTNVITNINVKPKINNITDYIKIAPNVYIFCNSVSK